MLAFPTLVKHTDGTHTWSLDALQPLPPELVDKKRMQDYLEIRRQGWTMHEYGYRNYAVQADSGDLFIFPAIIIDGDRTFAKKFDDKRPSYAVIAIERYGRQLLEFYDEQRKKIESEFNVLVHDLRRLSGAIYHAAQEASDTLEPLEYMDQRIRDARNRVENIIGAQAVLKIRTDILDYSGAPSFFEENTGIPVYRKFDKVIKSMAAFAAKKRIEIRKSGSSFRESYGPNAFEVIAYVLLDNAIKYSPYNNDILVKFCEVNNELRITVESVGPTIGLDELNDVFERGFRGAKAKTFGVPGSGLGLYLAKKLVGQFSGTIAVESANSYQIDAIEMSDIRFTIKLPLIQS